MIPHLLQNRKNIIDYLATELENSRIALVLGSGICYEFGLQTWDDLVRKVCEKTGTIIYSKEKDKYQLMNLCKTALKGEYKNAVKEVLYEKYSPTLTDLASHELLVSLGALVIGSKRGKISTVISYNFDDILETYLFYHGYMPNIITKFPFMRFDSDVDVYHPHGYLPKFYGKDSENIILDLDSYNEHNDNEDLLFSQSNNIFISHTLLLIGLSGDDLDLNKLLNNCKKNHFSAGNRNKVCGFIFKRVRDLQPHEVEFFQEKGIICIQIKEFNEISGYITEICQKAAYNKIPKDLGKN